MVLEGFEGGGLSSLLLLLLRCIIKQSLRVELKQPMVGRGWVEEWLGGGSGRLTCWLGSGCEG